MIPKRSEEKPGIFDIVNSSGCNQSITFKIANCDFYEYRLIYYFLLYLKYEVPSIHENKILIKNLIKLIEEENNGIF